ncbi:MAG: translocation/assembly module TamB domain-containing protein [Candidatus Omnitrophica bacterium]|nr:translocation/assembly module TamB domain-containing protein [Candidatus Omnitrophota bacterium]
MSVNSIIKNELNNVLKFKLNKIGIVFALGLVMMIGLIYLFIFTKSGALMLTRFGTRHYAQTDELKVAATQGNLAQGITYHNLELNNIKIFPQGSIVKIQQLDARLDSLSLDGLNIQVQNARLFLPSIDTVLVYGTYGNSSFDVSVYSKLLHVRALFDLLPAIKNVKNISGIIEDCDIKIKGQLFSPIISGTLFVRELKWNQFVMRNCPVAFNLNFSDVSKELKLTGKINFKSGELSGKKTALVKLQESSMVFMQDPMQPVMNISGNAVVEKTKISIIVKGDVKNPEIGLNSEPVLAKDKLVVMLATNQTWKGISGSLENSRISPELSADLFDYFVFGTAGKRIAKLLGVDSVSIKYDGKTKEAQVTKEISSSTGISYGVEQTGVKPENENVSQKLGIDQKISKSFSLEAEKTINNGSKENLNQNGEANLWLKFKKSF